MHRRTVHRGIAALALMSVLSVAGARPAAAAHQGFLGQLAEAWSAATGDSSSFFDRLARWVDGGEAAKAPRARMTAKQTWGIDPNGNSILLEPTDPARPAPGHD
jgi:hypothetical protein